MTFNAPNGTRGARQPKANAVSKWFNGLAIKRVRSKSGPVMGMNLLVLNSVGAKSGAERATPVAWFAGEGESWLIIASAAGATNNPAWFYNIASNPDRLSIDVGGKNIPVSAQQLEGSDRERAWASIVAASPRFAEYETKTDRVLPVIRLSPRQ